MKALIRLVFLISIIIVFSLSIVNASKIPNFAMLSFMSDKFVHALTYFYLTLLGLFSRFNVNELFVVMSIFIFGLIIELIHYFHPYRYFEYFDLLANLIGVTIALQIFRLKKFK
ncbi:MAG: VanZ family protein [Gammaproteobacteria bacterium]|jgi:VanZ family protein|tara:strand:+ start:1636 stop:1977 length:342 start_codon:yes stop_codon:yes gene_type:complete